MNRIDDQNFCVTLKVEIPWQKFLIPARTDNKSLSTNYGFTYTLLWNRELLPNNFHLNSGAIGLLSIVPKYSDTDCKAR